MGKSLEDLKLEATELGIDFNKNIGAVKLQEKIDAKYEAESKSADIAKPKEEAADEVTDVITPTNKETALIKAKRIIAAQEKENLQSVVVSITMVDKREASSATEVYLGNGDVGMKIPLDTFVEIPKILAELADEAKAVMHVDVDGISTPKHVKKYVVEYKK